MQLSLCSYRQVFAWQILVVDIWRYFLHKYFYSNIYAVTFFTTISTQTDTKYLYCKTIWKLHQIANQEVCKLSTRFPNPVYFHSCWEQQQLCYRWRERCPQGLCAVFLQAIVREPLQQKCWRIFRAYIIHAPLVTPTFVNNTFIVLLLHV